jgi:hypothetical protein
MKPENIPPDPDPLQRRCPRLGGTIDFAYCRRQGDNGLPCFKVFDCWWEIFDVVGFFRGCLSEAEFEKIAAARPQPKITSILELVEQAKKRLDEPFNR